MDLFGVCSKACWLLILAFTSQCNLNYVKCFHHHTQFCTFYLLYLQSYVKKLFKNYPNLYLMLIYYLICSHGLFNFSYWKVNLWCLCKTKGWFFTCSSDKFKDVSKGDNSAATWHISNIFNKFAINSCMYNLYLSTKQFISNYIN